MSAPDYDLNAVQDVFRFIGELMNADDYYHERAWHVKIGDRVVRLEMERVPE